MNWKAANEVTSWRRLLLIVILGMVGGTILPSKGFGVAGWIAHLLLLAALVLALQGLAGFVRALMREPGNPSVPGGNECASGDTSACSETQDATRRE